jgi:hypothetical protein
MSTEGRAVSIQPGKDKVRIAQLAPLAESVPPKLYGGTERMPLDGALRARCLNGAKFYIKLTSPAHSVWKGGPTVFRCDGAYMRDAMKCREW